jgi:predicted dehydrogenase
MELYGTKVTLVVRDEDPNAGPNVFGGDVYFKDRDTYRWKSMPRREEETAIPWNKAVVKHGFSSTSYVTNHRGIGLIDTVRSIRDGKPNRASGEMALHMLEVCEGILTSAREKRYVELHSVFTQPDPMPVHEG